jgi:peptidoglycan/LPS O-acetylase OafA/YrhL
MLLGLLLFGVSAIRNKPLPRWNALPLLTASPLLLIPIMGMITGSDELSVPVLATLFSLIAAGFIALGYVVQGDAGEELRAA